MPPTSVWYTKPFLQTWNDANAQIIYAEKAYQEPLPREVEAEVDQILRTSGITLDPRVFRAVKRLFFTFDFDKNKSLSRSEVRKGIAYLALEKAGTPPPQEEVDKLFDRAIQSRTRAGASDRLDFVDFMRMYSMMIRSNTSKPALTLG